MAGAPDVPRTGWTGVPGATGTPGIPVNWGWIETPWGGPVTEGAPGVS